MAPPLLPAPTFQRRLLCLAIASTGCLWPGPALLAAEQEWGCRAVGDQWQCQSQPRRGAGRGGLPATFNQDPSATSDAGPTHRQPWDWVKKSQLNDPSLCDTGCDGAYVAPTPDWPDATQAPEVSPLRASAASSRMAGNIATLSGEVTVSQGSRLLRADQVTLDRNTRILTASGNIAFREPNLLVTASATELNLDTSLGTFENARFLQHDQGLRGSAGTIARDSDSQLRLEQSTVTHCPPDDEVWKIAAGNIELDNATGWGSAHHARLNIYDVPVFYLPYMTFPIDDRRKSGFLWPSFGSSSSGGFEFTAPYYLNLGANYDATFAPRYIENRGTMPQLELRYLNGYGDWTVGGAYLKDDLYRDNATALEIEEEDIPTRDTRWVGTVRHSGYAGPVATRIDYTKVSDDDFFRHLNPDSLELRRSSHVLQEAELTVDTFGWRSSVLGRRYQTLDADLEGQYQFLPRFALSRHRTGANFSPEWLAAAEYTEFDHDDGWDQGGTFTTGARTWAEGGVALPMRGSAGFIVPTAKLRSIYYDLDATATGADTLSATSPMGSLDMGLIFDRQGDGYTQTLEPRLFYLYSEYDPQASHPNFDTRELTFSYNQLFRETRFTGHDRLDDANQLSVGASSRFLDNRGLEFLRLSLGQIFYFEDRQVVLTPASQPQTDNSRIAAEVVYQPHSALWFRSNVLWDSRQDLVDEGGVSIHYQSPGHSLYNLGYRFRRNGIATLNNQLQDLSQVDASLVYPLGDRWNLYARYRYDTEQHRSVDDLVGLRYEDCCWAVSLLYQRGIEDEYLEPGTGNAVLEHDSVFVLEFQLKGLGNLGNTAWNMLSENILGYEDFAE